MNSVLFLWPVNNILHPNFPAISNAFSIAEYGSGNASYLGVLRPGISTRTKKGGNIATPSAGSLNSPIEAPVEYVTLQELSMPEAATKRNILITSLGDTGQRLIYQTAVRVLRNPVVFASSPYEKLSQHKRINHSIFQVVRCIVRRPTYWHSATIE